MHSWFVIENCLRHQIIICSNWRESKIVLDIFSKVMSVHLLWILMKEFINKTLLSNAFPDCLLVIIGKGHYWEWKIIVRLWKSVLDCYTIYWRRQNTSDLQMLNVFLPTNKWWKCILINENKKKTSCSVYQNISSDKLEKDILIQSTAIDFNN